jgi:predicted cupin superfamily sugar epimerase
MPRNIVDLSARSALIRDEPWHLHFWESSPREALEFLRNPRAELEKIGIDLPRDCRVETVITNHDWMAAEAFAHADQDDGVVVCNVGGGDVAIAFYRVTMYAHNVDEVGKHEKRLLHEPGEEMRAGGSAAA